MRPFVQHHEYRPDIDGLRAIAVLSVVIFHAFPEFMRGGFIGVDIFFVISGFLISKIIIGEIQRESFSFIDFYSRRIRRIFPALIIVLTACTIIGWIILLPGDYSQLGKHLLGGATFTSNFILWSEAGYFDSSAESKPLLHLWSLAIEEQFYIIWPLLLWLCARKRKNLLSMTILAAAISFAANIYLVKEHSTAAFYSPFTRFWEILFGGLLACISIERQELASRGKGSTKLKASENFLANALSMTGILLLVMGFSWIEKTASFPGAWALLPVLATTLLIYAGPATWFNRHVLSSRILVWFGLISFPLYLWHWPLLVFARIAKGGTPSLEFRLMIVVLSILLAWATYRFIEQGIRKKTLPGHKSLSLATAMTLTGLAGLALHATAGVPSRFPEAIRSIAEYAFDYRPAYRAGSCFLDPEQDHAYFSTCDDGNNKVEHRVLLWGDSHAAHLYPGYLALKNPETQIIQRTASGCPPLLEINIESRPHCQKVNDHVIKMIHHERPEKVVLAAIWTEYDLRTLEKTLESIRVAGVRKIDFVGPVPQWNESLPRQLHIHFSNSIPHVLPERMKTGLRTEFFDIEDSLKLRVQRLGARYISAQEILCNAEGCLTRVGDSASELTAWDYGHLTQKGSEFLVSGFPKDQ